MVILTCWKYIYIIYVCMPTHLHTNKQINKVYMGLASLFVCFACLLIHLMTRTVSFLCIFQLHSFFHHIIHVNILFSIWSLNVFTVSTNHTIYHEVLLFISFTRMQYHPFPRTELYGEYPYVFTYWTSVPGMRAHISSKNRGSK